MRKIILGDTAFYALATTGWVFSDLVDWYGQVSSKTAHTPRPQQHGSFAVGRVYRSSRAISFNAAYLGSDIVAAVDAVAAIGAEGPVLIQVTEDDGTVTYRTVTVETSAYKDHHGNPSGEIAVDMIADDPRRYADGTWQETGPAVAATGLVWPAVWPLVWPSSGSSGRVTLTNMGKAPSAPVFTLQGAFTSALITCVETGARIGFGRPVPAGSVVDISGRHAVIDGQSDVSRWLQFREWEDVPPGVSRTYQFDAVDGASSRLLGKVDSAWW